LVATFITFPDASVFITPEEYFTGTGVYQKDVHFVDTRNPKYKSGNILSALKTGAFWHFFRKKNRDIFSLPQKTHISFLIRKF